jgi:hypothetical protein
MNQKESVNKVQTTSTVQEDGRQHLREAAHPIPRIPDFFTRARQPAMAGNTRINVRYSSLPERAAS